ncbi:hypothetical protein KFL_002120110 [Klebsormidium nitens]|uniref:Uncharacterized protein n=1 Tax=Klebsormidium nitens TaxID=105231 RepID=A0A1Y1I889_KLENI|nr:hypothetical protein KFL_002120110 [Klebsormidium nitens]|eukprot:GAQ84917.1 hypothetical protein KFL_002120110 [Klebsormidium nitens]
MFCCTSILVPNPRLELSLRTLPFQQQALIVGARTVEGAPTHGLRGSPRSVSLHPGRRLQQSQGTVACPSGQVAWTNCGVAFDATKQVCINGRICLIGQELCSNACFYPTKSSCIAASLERDHPGANDGSETRNCTTAVSTSSAVSASTAVNANPVTLGAATPASPTYFAGASDRHEDGNVAAVVGGIVGGVTLLGAITIIVIIFSRRRRSEAKATEFKKMIKETAVAEAANGQEPRG